MDQSPLARGWALAAGLVLVLVGALGLTPNAIVGGSGALVATSAALSVVHVASGILALFVCARVAHGARASALMGFGILYALVFVAVSTTPAVFGLFAVGHNTSLNVIHFGMAAVSFTVGLMARSSLAPVRV